MSDFYEASKQITGVNSARGLLALAGGGNGRNGRIHEVHITQVNDTSGQQLEICIQSTAGTVTGSGAADGQKLSPNGVAANFSPTYNITSEPSYAGNPVGLEGQNCQAGYHYVPPRALYALTTSQKGVVRLRNAPSPAIDLDCRIVWEEYD